MMSSSCKHQCFVDIVFFLFCSQLTASFTCKVRLIESSALTLPLSCDDAYARIAFLVLVARKHIQVEWSGGVETMDEILSRIYQREEAAVKRERAMAYAFSHQWRANPGANHWQTYEIGSGNWGWSWMERWITARPWEMRISSLQKTQSKVAVKAIKKGDPSIASAQSSTKPPIPTTKIPAKKFSARLVEEKAANKEQNPAMVTMQTCEVV